MHMRSLPFYTKNIWAPYGDLFNQIYSLNIKSLNCSHNSRKNNLFNSHGVLDGGSDMISF